LSELSNTISTNADKTGCPAPSCREKNTFKLCQILELISPAWVGNRSKNIKGSMNCAIHGVVHAYPHCVGFERDHLTQNEWLDTKQKEGKQVSNSR